MSYEYATSSRLNMASWWCDVRDCDSNGGYVPGLVYTGLEHTSEQMRAEAAEHVRDTGHAITFVSGVEETMVPMRTEASS